jgi:hypothetical protein
MAKEEGEGGAALHAVDDALGGALAEEVEAFFFITGDAGDSNHDPEETRERRYSELLDTDGHLGVGIVGVEAESLFAVLTRRETLAGGGDIAVIAKRNESSVHAFGISAGEVGIGVFGIGFDLLVTHGDDRVGELVDTVSCCARDNNVALGKYEGIVSVVGGVEEVLMVKFPEDEGHQDVVGGHRVLRVGALNRLEAGEGGVVVEIIEESVSLADLRG